VPATASSPRRSTTSTPSGSTPGAAGRHSRPAGEHLTAKGEEANRPEEGWRLCSRHLPNGVCQAIRTRSISNTNLTAALTCTVRFQITRTGDPADRPSGPDSTHRPGRLATPVRTVRNSARSPDLTDPV
jgi:hypothetical protein